MVVSFIVWCVRSFCDPTQLYDSFYTANLCFVWKERLIYEFQLGLWWDEFWEATGKEWISCFVVAEVYVRVGLVWRYCVLSPSKGCERRVGRKKNPFKIYQGDSWRNFEGTGWFQYLRVVIPIISVSRVCVLTRRP